MPQLNFSAPKSVVRLLKNTQGDKSLSRHILNMVLEGFCRTGELKKRRSK